MKNLVINVFAFILIVILILLTIWLGVFAYKELTYTRIQAEFSELEPFENNMPVYFKGFKIGRVTKILPTEDYTATIMQIVLYPKNLKLPQNIKAQVRSAKGNFDYVELDLPELASTTMLKDGDTIKGKSSVTFESLLRKHAESGSLDVIIENLGDITESVNKTVLQAEGLLKDIRHTVKISEKNILTATQNIATMSKDIVETSSKVNHSLSQQTLDKTMNNLEQTTKNIEMTTQHIDYATRNLQQTMDNVNSITENVDEITNGINCTMKKRFGGLRLLFGKSEQCCKKCKN